MWNLTKNKDCLPNMSYYVIFCYTSFALRLASAVGIPSGTPIRADLGASDPGLNVATDNWILPLGVCVCSKAGHF